MNDKILEHVEDLLNLSDQEPMISSSCRPIIKLKEILRPKPEPVEFTVIDVYHKHLHGDFKRNIRYDDAEVESEVDQYRREGTRVRVFKMKEDRPEVQPDPDTKQCVACHITTGMTEEHF